MGMYPYVYIINTKVFQRPECPKGLRKHLEPVSNVINVGGEELFIIPWFEGWDCEPVDEFELEPKQLIEYRDEYGEDKSEDDEYPDSYRVITWLEALGDKNEGLYWRFSG